MTAKIRNVEKSAELLSAIGNAKRLSILENLLRGEMNVNALAQEVDLSQSALSQHLARLRKHGLVNTRRDKQMIYYSSDSHAVRRVIEVLAAIEAAA